MSVAGVAGEEVGLYEAFRAVGGELCPALGVGVFRLGGWETEVRRIRAKVFREMGEEVSDVLNTKVVGVFCGGTQRLCRVLPFGLELRGR